MVNKFCSKWLMGCFICAFSVISFSAENTDNASISLPNPQMDKGKPLMQVLKERKSSRDFSSQKIGDQDLSNLLWAGFGINRPETGGTGPLGNEYPRNRFVCDAGKGMLSL